MIPEDSLRGFTPGRAIGALFLGSRGGYTAQLRRRAEPRRLFPGDDVSQQGHPQQAGDHQARESPKDELQKSFRSKQVLFVIHHSQETPCLLPPACMGEIGRRPANSSRVAPLRRNVQASSSNWRAVREPPDRGCKKAFPTVLTARTLLTSAARHPGALARRRARLYWE